MLPPLRLPRDRANIHPWVSDLLDKDVAGVTSAIHNRMSANSSPEIEPLIACVVEFVPTRIEFWKGVGYVLCIKRTSGGRPTGNITDQLYVAQPLPEEVIIDRVKYFDKWMQPLMKEFSWKFSGCGEEMEGCASGQFVFLHNPVAYDVCGYAPEKLGEWNNSHLLYRACNGDSVFITHNGATAWHDLAGGEVVPLLPTFPEFIRHYSQFRKTKEDFNCWESLKQLGRCSW